MPFYDLTCSNSHEQHDVWLRVGERPPCPTCGSATETLWSTPAAVIQDSIEGGLEIRHGLCWPDGSPRKFYSKTEIARAAKEKGLIQADYHAPLKGSDRSPHTTRWI